MFMNKINHINKEMSIANCVSYCFDKYFVSKLKLEKKILKFVLII